jgi:hypothetical protein
MENLGVIFAVVPDPRAGNARHDLTDVLAIAFAATLCGAETCCDMALFGRSTERLLREMLPLAHGIASHDTFSRVFRLIDPEAFEAAFRRFAAAFAERLGGQAGLAGQVVAIDGNRGPLHRAMRDLLEGADPAGGARTSEVAHGREENRQAVVLPVPPDWPDRFGFCGLAAVARIDAVRRIGGAEQRQSRYFALSSEISPVQALRIGRGRARTTRPRTSPSCDASPSTSCAPTPRKPPYERRSKRPDGTISTSSTCSAKCDSPGIGERYDPDGLTAAHRTLPLGTRVMVVNQRNGRSVVVRINDRVPKTAKLPVDLSRGSARAIGMTGIATVALYEVE